LATEVPGVGRTPQGATGTKMASAGVSESMAPGDVAPSPWSLGALSPGVTRTVLARLSRLCAATYPMEVGGE
jgi:hypothetical protein